MSQSNKKPRPLHPFRYIASGRSSPVALDKWMKPINHAEKEVLDMLKGGVRLLFDIENKKALLYRFRRGIEIVKTLTVRSLSTLIAKGHLVMVGREGRLIHYAVPGHFNAAWYAPETGANQ